MKRKIPFNIIDFIIIAVIIVGLVAGYSLLTKKEVITSTAHTSITYAYETLPVSQAFVDSLVLDTPVFNSSRNFGVGTLVDFEVKPYELITKDLIHGVFRLEEVPNSYTVILYVRAQVTDDAYHFWANQESIKVGTVFPIKGKGFASNGVVIAVDGGNK